MKTRRRNVSVDPLTVTRSKTTFSIPIDLLIEIFSRLPVKSIAACRCVSKLWSSILVRPDFTELFLTISSTRPQVLFACHEKGDLFFFSQPQSQSQSRVNQLAQFERPYGISGLVHGLVCLIYDRILKGSSQRVAMICNPSTGQALDLPKVKSRRVGVRSLLGYDPIGKQFKVLSMTRTRSSSGRGGDVMCEEHQVLTLGNGKMSWRMIDCCVPHYYYPDKEICINGVLYYTSVSRSTETYLIVCFDVSSEKFSFINVKKALNSAVLDGTLVDYNGKVGLFQSDRQSSVVTRKSTSFKLWVLEDLEKQEWSEHIYLFPNSWKYMGGKFLSRFVGVTRTNEIVLLSYPDSTSPAYLFYFNLKMKSIARVEIQGMDDSKSDNIFRAFTNHVEDVKLIYEKITYKNRGSFLWLNIKVVDNYYRPDLKKFALARLSVISKSIRVAKSGAKQRNRQA